MKSSTRLMMVLLTSGFVMLATAASGCSSSTAPRIPQPDDGEEPQEPSPPDDSFRVEASVFWA